MDRCHQGHDGGLLISGHEDIVGIDHSELSASECQGLRHDGGFTTGLDFDVQPVLFEDAVDFGCVKAAVLGLGVPVQYQSDFGQGLLGVRNGRGVGLGFRLAACRDQDPEAGQEPDHRPYGNAGNWCQEG